MHGWKSRIYQSVDLLHFLLYYRRKKTRTMSQAPEFKSVVLNQINPIEESGHEDPPKRPDQEINHPSEPSRAPVPRTPVMLYANPTLDSATLTA